MRPLSELPRADVVGLFTDLDDTLTWHGAVVPEAYAALVAAHERGLRVVVATGRPGGFAEVLATLWPVDAVVAENGAYAVLRDGTRRYWDESEAARIEQQRRLDVLVDEAQSRFCFARLADDRTLRRVDLAFDVNERQHLGEEQIDALTRFLQERGARTLVSTIHLHAFYGDHDKAGMLLRLAALLWGDSEEEARARYLYIGDSPNDQAGFARFPLSAGVANVARFQHVLQPPPTFVASREGGHGFAEIVAALLK